MHSIHRARPWRRFLILLLAATVLAPPTQAAELAPQPKPGLPQLAIADTTYPRATTEVEIAPGLKVLPLKTVTSKNGRQAVADRLVVVFGKDSSAGDVAETHRNAALRGKMAANPLRQLGPNTQLVDVSGAASLNSAIKAYQADPRVKFAAPDLLIKATETPNDPNFGTQWGMTRIQAPQAWNRTHGSLSRRIAILDTGIDEANPDLAGRVIARRDFTGSASGFADRNGHGTHVAGIAAAATNNGVGVAGVSFGASLLNGKVLDDTGNGSLSMLVDAIRWSVSNGAEIINMSLGSTTNDDCVPSAWEDLFDFGVNELQDAINEAFSANVVLVASAGNNGTAQQLWPAACPNVLSVADTDVNDNISPTSTFGTWVDVAAPGSGILSTAVPGAPSCAAGATSSFRFAGCSGTSMAAPHVSGLAALVRTSCGFTNAGNIVSRVKSTADQITGTGSLWQSGRINALKAVCFPAPTNLRVGNVTSNSIEILWNDGGAPADSSTEVHYRQHNAATWWVQVLAANRTSWLHQGATAAAGYDYKVRDCDANGCSAFTNTVTGFAGTTAFTLTVGRNGIGTIESVPAGITCPGDCSDAYRSGTVVTLHAEGFVGNNEEWMFTGWSGACTGRGDCTVTMNAAKSVTATFRKLSDLVN
jgi:thermitase